MTTKCIDWISAKKADKSWFELALLTAPIFLFMSHSPAYPLSLGGMSLRLTPAIVYVCTLAVLAIPAVMRGVSKYRINTFLLVVSAASLLYMAAGLMWTPSVFRGVFHITTSVVLFTIFFGAIYTPGIRGTIRELARITVTAAVVWCFFAWFEFWFGLFNAEALDTFCNSCSAIGFGFVRPAGLMFEPQIFGNFLLAPLLLTVYYILRERTCSRYLYVVLLIIASTIFVTLSRGAIYVAILGIVGMIVVFRRPRPTGNLGVTIFASLLVAISSQGLAASINPVTPTPFVGAVNAVIEQLSLGKISISVAEAPEVEATMAVDEEKAVEQPLYDGYVEISTDHRVSMTELSLQTWTQDPFIMIFGTGTGDGANSIGSDYGTVQNQHIEVLLNYGIVGYALFAMVVCMMFVYTRRYKYIWVILAAYLIQWCFFSGLPHGFFHVYFVLALCTIYGMADTRKHYGVPRPLNT